MGWACSVCQFTSMGVGSRLSSNLLTPITSKFVSQYYAWSSFFLPFDYYLFLFCFLAVLTQTEQHLLQFSTTSLQEKGPKWTLSPKETFLVPFVLLYPSLGFSSYHHWRLVKTTIEFQFLYQPFATYVCHAFFFKNTFLFWFLNKYKFCHALSINNNNKKFFFFSFPMHLP